VSGRSLRLEVVLKAVDQATRPLRQIIDGNKALTRAMKDSREQLASLNREQNRLDGFKKLKRSIGESSAEIRTATAKAQELGKKLRALEQRASPLDAAKAAFKKETELKADFLRRAGDERKRKGLFFPQGDESAYKEHVARFTKLAIHVSTLERELKQAGKSASAANRDELRKLQKEHAAALSAAGKLTKAHREKLLTLRQTSGELRTAGIRTKELSRHEAELKTRVDATRRALLEQETALQRVNRQQQRLHATRARFDKARQHAGNIAGAGAASGALGGGILFGAKQLLAPGYDFNASMSRVQALARIDKNSPEFAALRAQARQLGATTSYTAGQAADGQGFLAMAGFRPEQILKSMPSVLSMAKAGDLDMARAADISSNIMSGFGLDADEMKRVADVLTITFTTSNTSLEMLGDTMKYMGPVAKTAGMSLEQAAATAGLLGNAGIQASQAGTTLRSMLLRVAAPTSGAGKALKELSVRALDAKGNVRDIPTILRDVAVATAKMGSGKRIGYLKAIFGEEPAAGMAALIDQQGTKGIDKYVEIVKASAGTAEKVASVMADNLKGDVQNAISAWEDLGITVSDTVDPILRSVVQRVTDVTGAVSQWATAHPDLTRNLTQVMLVLGAILAALGTFALMLAAVLVPLAAVKMSLGVLGIRGFGLLGVIRRLAGNALPMLWRALLIVGRALVASPIGLTVTAIAVAAFLIIKYWTPIRAFMVGVFDGVAAALANLPATFQSLIAAARNVMSVGLTAIGTLILNWSPAGLFMRAFVAVFSWFGVQLPAQFTTYGQQILQGLAGGILSGLTTVQTAIRSVGDNVVGWFKERLGIHSPSRVFAALGGWTMAGLEQGLRAGQQGPLATVLELGKRIVAAGAGIGISGAAIAGSGPLAIDSRPPLYAATVPTASAAAALPPITINVYAAPGMDVQALARQVQQVLRQEQSAQAARTRSRLGDRD
jgi:TP901 family phage tail tape measure protein